MPSNRLWECLDIAGPSTLGALNRSALNYWCPAPDDCAWTFEALDAAQTTSDTLFGGTTLCDAKVVGDGTVNSLDIAVLMYAQFGEGPYESIFLPGQEPGRFNPFTTFGRDRTQHQCGNGMLPNQYQLQLSTDYCMAGHFPPYPPTPPTPPGRPPTAPTTAGRRLLEPASLAYQSVPYACLVDADGQCPNATADSAFTQYLVDRATALTPMRHMRAVATRWADLPGGEWSRIRVPGNLLALELFLINLETDVYNPQYQNATSETLMSAINSFSSEPPPPFNCTSDADCAPAEPGIAIRFRRRTELLRPGLGPGHCGFIEKSARNLFEGNVLAIRQIPPVTPAGL